MTKKEIITDINPYIVVFIWHGFQKKIISVRMRYGNPDIQNLGTLKIKFQIDWFFSSLSKNMGSDFIFRVAIQFLINQIANIWDP